MPEEDPFAKIADPYVKKTRWCWRLPLIGFAVGLIVGGMINSPIGFFGFAGLVLAGLITSIITLAKSKKHPGSLKHGISGLVISVLCLVLIIFSAITTAKIAKRMQERQANLELTPEIPPGLTSQRWQA